MVYYFCNLRNFLSFSYLLIVIMAYNLIVMSDAKMDNGSVSDIILVGGSNKTQMLLPQDLFNCKS